MKSSMDVFRIMFNLMLKKDKKFKKFLSPVAWLKEYCTLRFGLYRQAGHSSIIKEFINEESIVLVPHYNIGKGIYGGNNYLTFDHVNKEKLKGKKWIFVDNYSFMSKKQEDLLYKSLTDDVEIIALIQ